MTVYLCSTQPDIFRFLANKIEKLGHSCLLFTDYTNLTNTLHKSNNLPDLVLIDYMVENHILAANTYEKLDEEKIYLPIIYYNDPCIAKGARAIIWKDIVENFCNKEYAPENKIIPSIDEIETVLKEVASFVESDLFAPYIYLMQPPKPFPETFTTDYLYKQLAENKQQNKTILNFKDEASLPENLYVLLQIFFDNKDNYIALSDLQEIYSERKAKISEPSLKVMISQLRTYLRKHPDYHYAIERSPKGYRFSSL